MRFDADIQADVIEELQADPSVDATQVGVTVQHGIVTLTGHVPGYSQKWAAENGAKRVYGVRGVANEVDVLLAPNHQRTDSEIAQTVLTALKLHAMVPDDRIKVLVDHGWVTLEGCVDWQYQKDAAETAVRFLTGVKGLINWLTINPRVKPDEVKQKIQNAFERNADIEARRIAVESLDGKVTLRGNVRSWNEREEAQRAVWAIPGIREVKNELTVTP